MKDGVVACRNKRLDIVPAQSAMPPMDGETIFVGALMIAVPLAGAHLPPRDVSETPVGAWTACALVLFVIDRSPVM